MPRIRYGAAAAIAAILIAPAALLVAQERFQFVVSASDAQGQPVTDIKPEEVVMSENGKPNSILKVEPFRIPVRLTIAVDNGPLSREALVHYRTGLSEMVKGLPPDIEMTLITTAPQPRMVVRPTTNRDQILRGINGFAPENESPRFTDALVEYSERLQEELEEKKRADSLPVLIMISTTANEAASYEVAEVQRGLNFLQARKAKVFVTMIAVRNTGAALGSTSERQQAQAAELTGLADLNTNRQALIAIPTTKATGGRYEALAVSSRLATLLPEFGQDITKLHNKHYNQLLVTAERQAGISGPLQNPRIELTRQGLTGQVSLDGLP
jgi:hypothetical protein